MSSERAADRRAPAPPAEHKPIDAIALAREVVLERLQNLLEWLLMRLERYRAKRGNWWEQRGADDPRGMRRTTPLGR